MSGRGDNLKKKQRNGKRRRSAWARENRGGKKTPTKECPEQKRK